MGPTTLADSAEFAGDDPKVPGWRPSGRGNCKQQPFGIAGCAGARARTGPAESENAPFGYI